MSDIGTIRRPRAVEFGILGAALLACLLPFANKAFHIDDTLFVWAGQHISEHPLDFYGFNVNWYLTWEPMSQVTQNPPVGCYYLALVGSLFGWGEFGLHLAMLLPAWGAVWGTYRLSGRFGVRPLPAALLTLLSPAFLVCGTSVMCDVLMLCLWLWTVIVWDRGLRERSAGLLCVAGGLIALTTVTKYFGLCLVPLLGVYSLAVDRAGWRRWAAGLGVAVVLLAAYQAAFSSLYAVDRGLTGAMGYAVGVGHQSFGGRVYRLFEGLGFVGGCVGFAAVPAIALLPRRWLPILGLTVIVAMFASYVLTGVTTYESGYLLTDSPFAANANDDHPLPVGVLFQFLVWVAAGTAILLLSIDDLRTHRDPVALLLFLWVLGTFVFAAYVNWALNGRSVLPLIPAVAMVLVRRLERETGSPWRMATLLVPAAALALVVTYADARTADANRTAAERLVAEVSSPPGRPLWFEGHWGFQYYAQTAGARAWDFEGSAGRAGDSLMIPFNNCLTAPPSGFAKEVGTIDVPACPWAATMYPYVGAGFYACNFDWRPLPFVFTKVPPER
ncbi:MAG TPA: glycosyltransferase family 39 protein, partial [Gemmataceae bacterium]|nr:glycosyltransferase family 39 protein [Gemmataceae bacterium]